MEPEIKSLLRCARCYRTQPLSAFKSVNGRPVPLCNLCREELQVQLLESLEIQRLGEIIGALSSREDSITNNEEFTFESVWDEVKDVMGQDTLEEEGD